MIEIPKTLKSIGNCAFESSGLTSIVLPNNVSSIGYLVFANCRQLVSATIAVKIFQMVLLKDVLN